MVQHRLSPSGAPLLPANSDGLPFQRKYVASWNTIKYSASAVETMLQGPLGENPAILGFVAPSLGTYQLQLELALQVQFRQPTGAPATQDNTLDVLLQVSEDGGTSWIAPLWQASPLAGNGLYHAPRSVTATQYSESIAIKGDHIWTPTDLGIPLLARVAWLCSGLATGFQDVFSCYVDDNGNTGGWGFEGKLATWT